MELITLSLSIAGVIMIPGIAVLVNTRRDLDKAIQRIATLEASDDARDKEMERQTRLISSTRELMIEKFARLEARLQ